MKRLPKNHHRNENLQKKHFLWKEYKLLTVDSESALKFKSL